MNTTVPITCMQCDTMFSRFLMTTDLDILCDFSVSAGLTIRRDVWGVEDFYSLVSGWEVRTKQAGGDLSGPASSQPALGLPGVGSGFGVEDDGQHQQHQQLWEEVVILNKDDCSMEVDEGGKDVAQGPVKAVTGKKSGKRMSAASRMSRSDRLFRVSCHDPTVICWRLWLPLGCSIPVDYAAFYSRPVSCFVKRY